MSTTGQRRATGPSGGVGCRRVAVARIGSRGEMVAFTRRVVECAIAISAGVLAGSIVALKVLSWLEPRASHALESAWDGCGECDGCGLRHEASICERNT